MGNSKLNLHKILQTTPGEGLQPKEVLSYSFAGLGQNIICGLVASYITLYFTNGLLIESTIVGWIVLSVRLFDAFNDPIMGTIVDKTRTKDGKCRPYLKWTPIPIAAFTVLLFLPLTPGTTTTIVFITVFYVIWSVIYTIVDVPYWGLATSMTNDTHQRGVILSVARIFCAVGSGVVAIIVPGITGAWLSYTDPSTGEVLEKTGAVAAEALRNNYWWLTIILVVISIPAFYIGYKNTKERFFDNSEARGLKDNLKLLAKNKPLLLIIASGVLGSGRTIVLYSGIFFALYNITAVLETGSIGLSTVITLAIVPGGLAASLLVPYLTRKFGKKKTFIYSHLIGGIVLIAAHFCGWDEGWKLVVSLLAIVIMGLPLGLVNITSYAMIADSVDYLEWKTGHRAEGICFAMQTFINKIGMAIGAAITAFGLGWAKIYVEEPASGTMANYEGLNLIFIISILIPGISMLLSIIPILFYKFEEKEQAAAVKEIAERNAAATATVSAES
ncbi:MAG: glycoside-pentoside-hexuronide (GPH):cation symporter [Clostridiales bacterium]|jgi:sugar (glycoside-pentoside-hexuronide) transporter|nr:glycoside-pentoside-hexuronide (GPH):cation symporter [Clostridiales bacterium]